MVSSNWFLQIKNPFYYHSICEGRCFVYGSTEPGCFRSCSWCLWKALDDQEGVHGLGSTTFGLSVQKFLNIEWFFHWKLN
jgi:hypothetical protein